MLNQITFFEQGGTKCLYFLLLLDDEVTLR